MSNVFVALGALGALVSVAAGAFGAHALKQVLATDMLAVFHTAVDYQFFHSLGLLVIGVLQLISPRRCHSAAAWTMLAGIIVFSGSLYILSTTGIRWLGMVTPIGGIAFLAAWLMLAGCYLTATHRKED